MSTKTTFKRIALVAVAALGLGVLSVAPSSATVSNVTVALVQNGTSTNSGTGFVSDSTTAGIISISALLDNAGDTVTVAFLEKSKPSGADALAYSYFFDSTTPSSATQVDTATGTTAFTANEPKMLSATTPSANGSAKAIGTVFRISHGSTGYVGAKFAVQLDSATARTVAGTYTYTAVVKSYSGTTQSATTYTQDVSIVVPLTETAAAAAGGTIDPSKTTAVINAGEPTTLSAVDSSVAVVSTAAVTNHATIQVKTFTSASLAAPESITVTLTGAGLVCNAGGTVCGNNLTIAGDGDDLFRVRANGTAGTASIVVKTTTKTFPAKTVDFYAKSPATITVATNKPVISVAAASAQTDVVRAIAKDANGIVWGGQLYIVANSAADALIAGSTTPVACSYQATYGFHACPSSGVAKGTASLKVMDASLDLDGTIAAADAAVTSSTTSVRVSTDSAASAKIAFNKSSYAPGEKAEIWVTALDINGLPLAASTITNAFTADIVSSVAFSTGGTGLSGSASPVIAAATDAVAGTVAGYAVYTVYMPYASGEVKLTATGSTGLAAAGRVEVSATASVVNSSVDAATDAANEATDAANAATDAALAAADAADAATAAAQDASDAVAALSATVAKLVASLKAQITSLTNLVIKIQKKVRA